MAHPLFKVLEKDHDEQRDICKQLIAAEDSRERERLRERLYHELHPHIMGEEASIFDFLKQSQDEEVRADALEGLEEHHVDKILLRELMEIAADNEVFKAKAKVLTEVNNHHLDEEEDDIFEHLENLSDDQLDELLDLFQKGKENHR